MEVFNTMEPLLKTFWFVALPASLLFLFQTIMTFVGADSSDGLSADFDGDLSGGDSEFQLFSLRNLTNFLLGFGWTGIGFYDTIENELLLIGLSLAVGVLFVAAFFFIIQKVQGLDENNSFNIGNTLEKTAEVYLTIPEKRSGKGKITLSVNGSFRELDAITDFGRLASGNVVRIIKIENESLVLVEKIN